MKYSDVLKRLDEIRTAVKRTEVPGIVFIYPPREREKQWTVNEVTVYPNKSGMGSESRVNTFKIGHYREYERPYGFEGPVIVMYRRREDERK